MCNILVLLFQRALSELPALERDADCPPGFESVNIDTDGRAFLVRSALRGESSSEHGSFVEATNCVRESVERELHAYAKDSLVEYARYFIEEEVSKLDRLSENDIFHEVGIIIRLSESSSSLLLSFLGCNVGAKLVILQFCQFMIFHDLIFCN